MLCYIHRCKCYVIYIGVSVVIYIDVSVMLHT